MRSSKGIDVKYLGWILAMASIAAVGQTPKPHGDPVWIVATHEAPCFDGEVTVYGHRPHRKEKSYCQVLSAPVRTQVGCTMPADIQVSCDSQRVDPHETSSVLTFKNGVLVGAEVEGVQHPADTLNDPPKPLHCPERPEGDEGCTLLGTRGAGDRDFQAAPIPKWLDDPKPYTVVEPVMRIT